MDAIGLFLSRYGDIHGGLVEGLLAKLPEAQLRTRPHPGVNTISWLVWHSARIEDLAVNRFLSDRRQVLDEGWLERLAVPHRERVRLLRRQQLIVNVLRRKDQSVGAADRVNRGCAEVVAMRMCHKNKVSFRNARIAQAICGIDVNDPALPRQNK
jgi:hypothetical protein